MCLSLCMYANVCACVRVCFTAPLRCVWTQACAVCEAIRTLLHRAIVSSGCTKILFFLSEWIICQKYVALKFSSFKLEIAFRLRLFHVIQCGRSRISAPIQTNIVQQKWTWSACVRLPILPFTQPQRRV